MHIELTDKQFRTLLELAFLGIWIGEGYRVRGDPEVKQFHELEQLLLSRAYRSGWTDTVEYTEELSEFFLKDELAETLIDEYIDEYDEESFWEELMFRLARRDFTEKYGETRIRAMTDDERIGKEQPFLDGYAEEFQQFGIDRLRIVEAGVDRD